MASGKEEINSLENRASGASWRRYRSFSLRLYASCVSDKSSNELGIYEHQGRFFLLDQPQSIFGKAF